MFLPDFFFFFLPFLIIFSYQARLWITLELWSVKFRHFNANASSPKWLKVGYESIFGEYEWYSTEYKPLLKTWVLCECLPKKKCEHSIYICHSIPYWLRALRPFRWWRWTVEGNTLPTWPNHSGRAGFDLSYILLPRVL